MLSIFSDLTQTQLLTHLVWMNRRMGNLPEGVTHFFLSIVWLLLTQYPAGLTAREMNGKCLGQVHIMPVLALQHRNCPKL